MSNLVLVSGAAGRMGATGRHLTKLLLQENIPVRAMVRQVDERSEQLAELGAEVVEADFLDEESVRVAMTGASGAYFCAPVSDTLLQATTVFAMAARAENVRRIVNVSQMGTKDPILSPATRLHRLGESIFEWSGVPVSHLRATVYLEQLTQLFGPGVRNGNVLAAPIGDARVAMVAASDVARVAAGIFTHPDRFGPGYYPITGGSNFTFEEAASILSVVLERPIKFLEVDPAAWKQANLDRGLPPHLAAHLDKLYEKGRLGRLDHTPTEIVERVGGAPPVSLEQFVRGAKGQLSPATA